MILASNFSFVFLIYSFLWVGHLEIEAHIDYKNFVFFIFIFNLILKALSITQS